MDTVTPPSQLNELLDSLLCIHGMERAPPLVTLDASIEAVCHTRVAQDSDG